MSPDQDMREEREDIELLLPWYAAGTLEPDELKRVEAYLQDHPELEDHLAVVREELEETVGVNEAIGTPSAGAMDRLMAWLPEHIPDDGATSIAHGDFGLNNVLIHPTEPRLVAVLDWELSTIGHPLADLTYHLMQWQMPTCLCWAVSVIVTAPHMHRPVALASSDICFSMTG